MKRRLLNLATVLSMLAFAAALALWVRSYMVRDARGLTAGRHSVWATSRLGTIELKWLRWNTSKGFAWQVVTAPANPASPEEFTGDALERWNERTVPPGSRVYRTTTGLGPPRVGVVFPDWVLLIVAALLPVARAVSFGRRYWRRVDGLCSHCGYDLRATPEQCPECGTVAPAPISPMYGRLLNLLTALSLLLCLAVSALWVWSHLRGPYMKWVVRWHDEPRVADWLAVYSAPGVVGLIRATYDAAGPDVDHFAAQDHAAWADENRYRAIAAATPPFVAPTPPFEWTFWERQGFHLRRDTVTDTYDPNSIWDWFLGRPRKPVLLIREDRLFLMVRYWLPASATAVAPVGWALIQCARRWRRRTNMAAVLCP
jgi:hypothetical protein